MDFHKALAEVTRSVKFKDWHSQNSEYFLAHAFMMMDEANKGQWQIGFYNKEKERMVTFLLKDGIVDHTEDQEVLKKEGDIVELKVSEVKIEVGEALQKARGCLEQNYGRQTLMKEFFIIQHTEGSPMFNITFLTQAMKTINVKIHATSGEIIKHSSEDLVVFT